MTSRMETSINRGVVGHVVGHPGRKTLATESISSANLQRFQRIAPGAEKRDEKHVGFRSSGPRARRIGRPVRPWRHPSDGSSSRPGAPGRSCLRSPSLLSDGPRNDRNRELRSLRRGLPPDRAGRKVRFCSPDDVDDVGGSEIELRHANRVEDHPHAVVLLSEDKGVAHARDTLDVVDETDRRIVGEKERIVLGIGRIARSRRPRDRGRVSSP